MTSENAARLRPKCRRHLQNEKPIGPRHLNSTVNPKRLLVTNSGRSGTGHVRLHQDTGDTVGVRIAGWPAILEVAAALGRDLTGNTD